MTSDNSKGATQEIPMLLTQYRYDLVAPNLFGISGAPILLCLNLDTWHQPHPYGSNLLYDLGAQELIIFICGHVLSFIEDVNM